jgi:hypothetical protein
MLRIFSSIRKSLLAENKSIKYLKYALGEFILVVLGILVALQINNWNENRKLQQDRRELIENLKADFSVNLSRIEEELEEAEGNLERLTELLDNSGGEPTDMEVVQIKDLVVSTMRANGFEPVLGAYRSAISTGMIRLIDDRNLQTYFIEFESRMKRLEQHDQLWIEADFTGLIQDLRTQLGTINVLIGGNNIPAKNFQVSEDEFYQLIGTKEVYAFFETKRALKSRQVRNLKKLKEKTEQILTALEALD